MKVRAMIHDKQGNEIAVEIMELSDAPMYGRTPAEIEQLVSLYVDNWVRQKLDIVFDIIDNDSGKYPHIGWEKRD